jgi:hypothetical protein
MTTTIEIINGYCSIILKAENEFEKTLIENLQKESENCLIEATPRMDTEMYGNNKKNHRITIDIKHPKQ